MAAKNSKIDRRQFLKATASAVISLAVVGSAAYYFKDKRSLQERGLLRPPGSRKESEFLYACIKCGLCVQICPIHAIKLADWNDGLAYGTPYIDANKQACDFSCDAIQCAETCPTSAIDFQLFNSAANEAVNHLYEKQPQGPYSREFYNKMSKMSIEAMKRADKMGIAKIADPNQCLAYSGHGYKGPLGKEGVLRDPETKERIKVSEKQVNREICDLCVAYCPLGDDAIILEKLEEGKFLPKVLDGCVGCGVCQQLCPTTPKAIIVEPLEEKNA